MSFAQDPRFTFDTFVVGAGNRMAAAAARRVAEAPRTAYNPLFIHGEPGSGKTHLLQAVGALALAVRPELRVVHLSADALVDRVSAAVGSGSIGELRDELLEAELVLLDEVHRLEGKSRTQEELLRLWDELEREAQVVLASRRPPGELEGIAPELAARMVRGLTVDLPAEVAPPAPAGEPEPELPDEFSLFLSDITATVGEIVETAPWRKKLAESILRWEGEGVRTRRLEAALDADTAPDVDGLLESFGADVQRLTEVRRELEALGAESARSPVLADPDRAAEAEALLVSARAAAERRAEEAAQALPQVDRWYLSPEKAALAWLALDDRLIEELV